MEALKTDHENLETIHETEHDFLETSIISTSNPQLISQLTSEAPNSAGLKQETSPGLKTETTSSSIDHLFLELTKACSAKHGIKEVDIEILEKLSESSCSRLYKVYEKKQDRFVYLKEFEIRDKTDKQEAILQFKTLLSFLKQNSNGDFIDVIYTQSKPNLLDPEHPIRRYYLLLDAGEGSLDDLIAFHNNNGKVLTQEETLKLFLKLIEQLKALYEIGIVCRDVKPEHIAFTNGKLKLVDFSHAFYLKNDETRGKLPVVGTPSYMAPELLKCYKKMILRYQYSPIKSDSYSAAKIILQTISPNCKSVEEQLQFTKENYQGVYEEIHNMLNENPKARTSFLKIKSAITFDKELSAVELVSEEKGKFKEFVFEKKTRSSLIEELIEQATVYSQFGVYKFLSEIIQKIGPKTEIFEELDPIPRIRLLDMSGEMASSEGNYNEAIQSYYQGLDLKQKIFGNKTQTCILVTYPTLAKLSLKVQNYGKAIEYYEHFVEICKEKDSNKLDLGQSYHELGMLYEQANNLPKAKEAYENSLKTLKAYPGLNENKLFTIYTCLGNLEEKTGRYNEAVEYLQLSLTTKLKTIPADHPSLAPSYNNLGLAYERISKGKYALENYQKALNIWVKTSGAQSEHVATAYNNIGSAYDSLGDRKQAVEYYEKALALRIQLFGHEHTNIAQIFNNLGTAYFHLQQYDKALDNYKKCLTIWKRAYGEENNKVATVYNNIANVYTKLKDKNEAKEYFAKSVEIKGKVLGKSHPSLATTYANLGVIYLENNEKEKALEVLELAYEIRCEQFGKASPATEEVYKMIVKLQKTLGKNK